MSLARGWGPPLALAVLSLLRLLGWSVLVAPSGPLGTDPAIWGLTALDLAAGNAPLAVPLYPWLTGLVGGLAGGLVEGGLLVSWAAGLLLPVAAWWAARPMGAGAGALAGGAMLLLPDPLVYAFQMQPDALTALWAVCLSGALLRERWGLIVPLAALGLVLREHGGPVAALVLMAALAAGVLSPEARWRRLGGALALLVAALVIPALFGGALGLEQPWSARSGEALGLLTTGERPPHLKRAEWALYRDAGVSGRALWHARRSLTLAADGWGWIVLAASLIGVRRRWRLALAGLAVVPVFGALLVWSERRHVMVMTPAVVTLVSAGVARGLGGARVESAALLAALALTAVPLVRLPEEARRQRAESAAFPPVQAVADLVCELAGPDDLLLTIDQRLLLWCPLPQLADPASADAWRAWLVAPPSSVRPPWQPVDRTPGAVWIWRLDPDRAPRPCQDTPNAARYLLASGPTPHPAFTDIPLPGRPPITLPTPEGCD